jgi:hypothetical protein
MYSGLNETPLVSAMQEVTALPTLGRALTHFFQEEALMLRDLAPAAMRDYVRALWFEGKRSGWPCASGAMDELLAQFLAGAILPTRDPQPQAARAAVQATREVLVAAIGPSSAAVVTDRALAAAVTAFPAARVSLTDMLA